MPRSHSGACGAPPGYWTIDDAGITYGAAFELADHHSLAPSLEGTPIEGYSNPLLFFIVALLRLVGLFDPVTTHVRLEMLVFAAMVTLVWSLLRALVHEAAALAGAVLFALVELVTPATWTWYGSGLENVWVAAGLVLHGVARRAHAARCAAASRLGCRSVPRRDHASGIARVCRRLLRAHWSRSRARRRSRSASTCGD